MKLSELDLSDATSTNQAMTYIKYKECEVEDVLVHKAEYLRRRPNKFNPDKNDHYFQTENGITCLNSAGQLNYICEDKLKCKEVDGRGSIVTIAYMGTEVMDKGLMKGKEAHQFDVRTHGEGIIDVGDLPDGAKEESKGMSLKDLE